MPEFVRLSGVNEVEHWRRAWVGYRSRVRAGGHPDLPRAAEHPPPGL